MSASSVRKPKFHLGQIVATPGALQALDKAGQTPGFFLAKHVSGDWGDCCPDDAHQNDLALRDGSRILSVYRTIKGDKLWIITEAEDDEGRRVVTTILRPQEY